MTFAVEAPLNNYSLTRVYCVSSASAEHVCCKTVQLKFHVLLFTGSSVGTNASSGRTTVPMTARRNQYTSSNGVVKSETVLDEEIQYGEMENVRTDYGREYFYDTGSYVSGQVMILLFSLVLFACSWCLLYVVLATTDLATLHNPLLHSLHAFFPRRP